ncbi:MAG: hypothetical protein JRF63_06925 [Deltaproteobacteria bacterium]|nr:hypothetical protein [Deltaproteobacteria bacterium]
MVRSAAIMVLAAAAYGFAIGSVHSPMFGARNLVKFPLLIVVTAAVCSVAYFLLARLVTSRLSFREVQELAVGIYRDVSLMLASVAPALLFLAYTIDQPTLRELREYPLFLGLNVSFVALAGTITVVQRARALLSGRGISLPRGVAIIVSWLVLSLLVGGQWAWYLRPFCGVSALTEETPFLLGNLPDYRGAANFYEAVFHLFDAPTLPDDWTTQSMNL